MPLCVVCGEKYATGERFCAQDGSALIADPAEISSLEEGAPVPEGNINLEDVTSFEPPPELSFGERDQDTAEELLAKQQAALEAAPDPEVSTVQDPVEELVSGSAPLLISSPALPAMEETSSKVISAEDRIGTMVGTYRLTKKLGEGGMGVVYEAIHPIIERKIAIKLIQPDQAQNPDATRRFFDEAKALSRSRHPNIVDIYDLGQLPDGTIFLEMELLNGQTLRDLLNNQGPPSASEIRRIFAPIALALKTAHDAGIIHRDLKPENIFLGHDGSIKLLDFGVSKLQSDRITHDGEHTQAGVLVGTPEYMSPEQAMGDGPIDHRADIYSFGVVLYEALCGLLPFDTTILVDILVQHIQVEFPRPSARAQLGLDALLEDIAMKCLAKSPDARFRSMGEVAQALGTLPQKPAPSVIIRDSFGISQGTMPAQSVPPAGEVTPGDLRRGAPLGAELKLKGGLWRRVDAANIGDVAAELSHEMTFEGELSRHRLEDTFPNGRILADDGVIHSGPLSLRLKGLTPGRELLLLFRIDVEQPQQIETLLNQEPVTMRPPEVDPNTRWRHETALIPGSRIKSDNVWITRSPQPGTTGNLYAVWAYQLISTGPLTSKLTNTQA